MVTGPTRFSSEKEESLFFSDRSLTLPKEALQKGLGRAVVRSELPGDAERRCCIEACIPLLVLIPSQVDHDF